MTKSTAKAKRNYYNHKEPLRMKVRTPKNEVQSLRLAKMISKGKPFMVNLEHLKGDTRDAAELHYKGLAMFYNTYVMQVTNDIIGFFPREMVDTDLHSEKEVFRMKEDAKRCAKEMFQNKQQDECIKPITVTKETDETPDEDNSQDKHNSIEDCIEDLRAMLRESEKLRFSELVPVDSYKLDTMLDRLEALAEQFKS